MRGCGVIIIFLLAFLSGTAQNITGFWSGTLFNDRTGRYQNYELFIRKISNRYEAITRTQFIINEASYFAIKRAGVKIKDNKIIITDLSTLFENYPVDAPKGVRQLNVLTLNGDSLRGPFATNTTKQYSEVTGEVYLQKKSEAAAGELEQLLTKGWQENTKPQKGNNKIPAPAPVTAQVNNALPAANVLERKADLQATVYFSSDTLRLSLYDNGVVDGDTVTVLVDNKIILANKGLSTLPIKYNLIIPSTQDSILLLMYAENLGSIAPNTGLLLIEDGTKRTELRFSGNLQQSAAILLKRNTIIKNGH